MSLPCDSADQVTPEWSQPLPGGPSSCSGNVLAAVYQADLDPQYILLLGRIPGSPSSEPAGTITTWPLFDSHGSDDPQVLQNDVAKYFVSGGSYRPTFSSPLNHLKSPGATNTFAAWALPETFWQREQ